jgi:hypothetical protein
LVAATAPPPAFTVSAISSSFLSVLKVAVARVRDGDRKEEEEDNVWAGKVKDVTTTTPASEQLARYSPVSSVLKHRICRPP